MDFVSLLLFGLMGTVCSLPVCPEDCELATRYDHQRFKLVSDLGNSSVAPWNLIDNSTEGREPQSIQHAKCKDCIVENMTAMPIYIEISVFQKMGTGSKWCRCPYNLAVGCTCVKQQQQ